MKKVAVILGSDSDFPVMQAGGRRAQAVGDPGGGACVFGTSDARRGGGLRGFGAGKRLWRNHRRGGARRHIWRGVLAAHTTLPVIGVPMKASVLDGMDALLATVQMPKGVPVATVAIDGADNAAILAAQILALGEPELAGRLEAEKRNMARQVLQKDAEIQEKVAAL